MTPPPPPRSVKVSLIMTAPDRWICVNVGLDSVDAMAKEMSIIWLVVDFFSNYHRSEVSQPKIRTERTHTQNGNGHANAVEVSES